MRSTRNLVRRRRSVVLLLAVPLAVTMSTPAATQAATASSAHGGPAVVVRTAAAAGHTSGAAPSTKGSSSYRVSGPSLDVTEARRYTVTLETSRTADWSVRSGADVTGWFVTADGDAAFGTGSGVATATPSRDGSRLVITVDASKIARFATNGPASLFVLPPSSAIDVHGRARYAAAATKVGRYVIPKLTVSSDLYGSAYTYGKSTLKEHFGGVVDFEPSTYAKLSLSLDGLRDGAIGSRGATVALTAGDGYYPSEYNLASTTLQNVWKHGTTTYGLGQGDLTIDTGGYPLADPDSGREWSALGGDGQGHYTFDLTVGGITYNGLPVASQSFRVHVYVYGYDYTADAAGLYGSGTPVTADIAPLADKVASSPRPGRVPVWTWVGDGSKPDLVDAAADDFYVTWPRGVDASRLSSSDVRVTLHSARGDSLVLDPATDYEVVRSAAGETQIALTYQNWAFEPVYSTMTVQVSGKHVRGAKVSASSLSASYDVSSVYAYEAQQGGGGKTVDGTVTAYSFYGLTGLTSWKQLMAPATYTLKATVDGATTYYAEDSSGHGSLVDTAAAARSYDGSGATDRNQQLIGNTLYITTRLDQEVTKTVGGRSVTFTKAYAGGGLLSPATADRSLTAAPGYTVAWGTTNWITHEKWAWQSSIATGWTGIDVQPYAGKFEWTVAKGAAQQFTADDPHVTWSLVGTHAVGTSISATGLLTVAADETASTVAVVATSTTDRTPAGRGTVNVSITGAPATAG
jgi:hypothetical protein